jgi:hypothetical protein
LRGSSRGGAVGGVVDRDQVEQVAGEVFAAVLDGQQRTAPDELREAADHAAGA